VVDLIERVDSPAVGAVYDSGNSIPFYKDPVEEARLLAPYGDTVWSVGTRLGRGRIPLAEIVETLADAPHLTRLMTQVCYGYAVRMPDRPGGIPSSPLYEPVERPDDPLDVWVPTGDGHHGYLEADEGHLAAAAGHVETSVGRMRHLLA
tara:strand:- start:1404 stop:1850 length:447 start_codon:yes stop_codon:yes gene_type:complete